MIANEINEKLIIAAIENSYDSKDLINITDRDLRTYLHSELDTILGYNDNIEMKQIRLHKFKVPSSVLEDYDQKIIEYGTNKILLAGIRHVGGNPEKPFIYIWPGFILRNPESIEEIKKVVVNYFQKFEPKYISIWLSQKSDLYGEVKKKIKPVQRLYVGDIKNIKRRKKPEKFQEGILKKIEDTEYYVWYENEYKKFHKKYPGLKDLIAVNSLELMEASRNEGLLYYYLCGEELIGIIAGEKRKIFNKDAVYINEIMISENNRGKKYAPVLMRKFIDQLPQQTEYIWSHIDSSNLASIKTAIITGQKGISEEFFIPI